MSVSTGSLESVAREVFEHQSSLSNRLTGQPSFGEDTMQFCPVSWLLPDLLHLLAEQHDGDARQLRPAIRRIILDRGAIYAMGTGLSQAEADEILDGQVDLLVRVLDEVRQRALDCGEWSEMAAAPEWFG